MFLFGSTLAICLLPFVVVDSSTQITDRRVTCFKNSYNIKQELKERWSEVRIPVWKIYCSLIQSFQTGSGAHLSSYLMDIGVLSLG
jgi:hypothetical protein